MPAFRVSAKHAAKVAQSRAAAHIPQESSSRMVRVHQGAGKITRRNPRKIAILSLMTVLALACVSAFDVSPVWIEFKNYVGARFNTYTSLFADCDHGEKTVATPRRLSNATDSCKIGDVTWAEQVGVTDAEGAGLINAKNDKGLNQQYAACVDLEDYMDKGRAGQYWMSGDSTHKGLTTLDCLATEFQFRSETSYQIDLCVRSKSGGEWYKDVEVKTMAKIGSPAERLKCDWWACDELGETKGQGKHCLHCKCGNPPNVTCEPKGDWCKEPCRNEDEKYLYRMSKAACPEICLMSSKMWVLPSFFFGMIYMFIALAIVVDEFFVPALELFCELCEISDDIAGATFMAAGGSMPELFTSFIGTFRESTVGFATIVGSAVFNVLFVIGVCAFAAEEPLQLTWWPLARDCSFYMVALFLVVLVFGINTPQEIDLWEAMVLLLFYVCYCSFMKFNSRVETWVKTTLCKEGSKVSPEDTEKDSDKTVFDKLSAFNSAIQKVLMKKYGRTAYKKIGIAMVTQINGNCEDTFNKVRSMIVGSNSIDQTVDKEKISQSDWLNLFNQSKIAVDNEEEKLRSMRMILKNAKCPLKGANGEMEMTEDAFKLFYRESLEAVKSLATNVFADIENQSGNDDDSTFNVTDAMTFFKKNAVEISKEEVSGGIVAILDSCEEEQKNGTYPAKLMEKEDDPESNSNVKPVEASRPVSEGQFQEWYRKHFIKNEEEEEDEGFTIDLPDSDATGKDWASYIICYPISAILYVFLPDVRRSYTRTLKWSVIEFCTSLIWIALFSLLLYEWLLVLCNSIGIPPKVAALTLLAGGTSVPDLLSSYVVAREGKGDMAVSSSIGSNIFDVTVGLPVPWICYSILNGGKSVAVVAKSLGESVMLLMIMLALVIGTVMAMKWEMNKGMGGLMMFFYLIFLVFSIAFSPVLPE